MSTKEFCMIAALLVSVYVFQRYANSKGERIDWTFFIIGAIVWDLATRAIKGL
jgi:hypothetical protein